jgi:murein DD-endopeptidase MepM/ murein hydrolase activator NlpD
MLFLGVPLCGQEKNQSNFPLIDRLDSRDVLFKQFESDVVLGRQAVRPPKAAKGATAMASALTIYSYKTKETDELMPLSARCNIPYDTIATLNRIQTFPQKGFPAGTVLLLPSVPGIFLPATPSSDLEKLIASSRGEDAGVPVTISFNGNREEWRFIPGDDFSPNERAFFLHPELFRFPLKNWRLTSAFGMRTSPISGKQLYHKGLDLAAPMGTDVFAARDGIVTETGESAVYGKYVVISHDGGWKSLYGHLSKIDAVLKSNVKTGTLIGRVGSTGLSTGPHLHFELLQNGAAQDPFKILGKK